MKEEGGGRGGGRRGWWALGEGKEKKEGRSQLVLHNGFFRRKKYAWGHLTVKLSERLQRGKVHAVQIEWQKLTKVLMEVLRMMMHCTNDYQPLAWKSVFPFFCIHAIILPCRCPPLPSPTPPLERPSISHMRNCTRWIRRPLPPSLSRHGRPARRNFWSLFRRKNSTLYVYYHVLCQYVRKVQFVKRVVINVPA